MAGCSFLMLPLELEISGDGLFKRHSRYNLPPERLKLIEKMLRCRARKLLE